VSRERAPDVSASVGPGETGGDAAATRGLDPLARALRAYRAGRSDAVLRVLVEGEHDRDLPVAHFFRDGRRLTAFDRATLRAAQGSVLDVGAGVGALALPLARAGHRVTALEPLPQAAAILRERGVADVREASVWTLEPGTGWDTVVALMNGTALAGTRARLPTLLERLSALTAPAGSILIDSTALCEPNDVLDDGRFAGELHFQLELDGERGEPFPQLFVPEAVLVEEAAALGLGTRKLHEDAGGRYLMEMRRAPP
jgi:SAM-dependent methyltransferase